MLVNPSDLVLHEDDKVGLPNRPTIHDVVETVRLILAKPSAVVERIVITAGEPISVTWRGHPEMTLDFSSNDDPAAVIRQVELLEADGKTVAEVLGNAILSMERRGATVTYAGVGAKSVLWRWLRVDLNTALSLPSSVAGGAICTSNDLGPFDLILFGGKDRGTQLRESSLAIRILMEV
jgi:hypothetical protein